MPSPRPSLSRSETYRLRCDSDDCKQLFSAAYNYCPYCGRKTDDR